MMSAKMNVPELRFGEFSGEWEEKKLGDIGKVSMCKRILKDQTTTDGAIPFYKIGTFGKIPDAFISKKIFEEFKSKYSFPKQGEILISASGTIGRTVVYDGSPAYFQDSNIVWIANNEELVINNFLLYCYINTKWNTENTTIARLYNQNLRSIPLVIPSKPEQEKIASFLSSVDRKIEQLSKKKRLLEQYKKGVMQKIFSQELRFKENDESEFPEWVEKKLGEIAIKKSSNISANKIEDNFGDYIIYGASGILKSVDFYEEAEDYVSIVKDGAGVGRILYCKGESSVLGTMDIIKPKTELNTYFLYCLLDNIDFKKYVSGSTIPHIYFKDYSSEKCKLPSLKEQTKIATFLSSLDKKIELTEKGLNATKEFKKGLLQKMFV